MFRRKAGATETRRAGRKAVFERFSAGHMARQFAEAYQTLLQSPDHAAKAAVAAI